MTYDLYYYNSDEEFVMKELNREECIDYLSSLKTLDKRRLEKLNDLELEGVFRENYYDLLMLYDGKF